MIAKKLFLQFGDGGEGDVRPCLGLTDDKAGVLLGKESLGKHNVEIAGLDTPGPA